MTVDCACLIHGNAYDWTYVERLHGMLDRHISDNIRLHVYTEADRLVPDHMVKHPLIDWGIGGPKKSWWYKMQLFNSDSFMGPLLYFDLDIVVVKNIDWVFKLPGQDFWTVRDFKYLWRPNHMGINSSIMYWDTKNFNHVWQEFRGKNLQTIMRDYRGDQDYITEKIEDKDRRFFDTERVKSWRWQALDGGYDFVKRRYQTPGSGTNINDLTSILIFHGNPKPENSRDPVIIQHWQ
jgi:hypothetical protein